MNSKPIHRISNFFKKITLQSFENNIEKHKINIVILALAIAFIIIKDGYIFPEIVYVHDTQNIYSYYSSSVQVVATFIAFLIAGYAIVNEIMKNLKDKYEEKKEIYVGLEKKYYNQLKILTLITGLTIILSLIVLWALGYGFQFQNYLIVVTDFFIVLTIMGAIWFVLEIIDPDKGDKIAKEIRTKEFGPIVESGDVGTFIENFINLESLVRRIFVTSDLRVGIDRPISMRRMLEILLKYQIVSKKTYDNLIKVNKYRNLVVHGHQKDVDEKMIEKVITLTNNLNQTLETILNQHEDKN